LEIISIEKVDCPPEKCVEQPKGTTGGVVVAESKQPTTPKKPEEPKEPKQPPPEEPKEPPDEGVKKPPPGEEGGGKTPKEEDHPPPFIVNRCDCKFLEKEWMAWQTIEGYYVYIPPPQQNVKIPLDGNIELKAIGTDTDILIVRSFKTKNGELICEGSQNVHSGDLLKYTWKMISGEGKFSNGARVDEGESVIYQPPDNLPLGTHKVIIETMIEDTKSKGIDDPNKGAIHIDIKRNKEDPNFYYADFHVLDFLRVKTPPKPPIQPCDCQVSTGWEEGSPIKHTMIKPNLESDFFCIECTDLWLCKGADMDDLVVTCVDPLCGKDVQRFSIADVLIHNWAAELGSYLGGNDGGKVIYKAPLSVLDKPAPNEKITLTTRDAGGQFADPPPKKEEEKITIAEVDLDIYKYNGSPVPDDVEDIIGGRICLNCEDDNKSEVSDLKENNVDGEDDLVKLVLQKTKPGNLHGNVVLKWENNGGKIRIWEDVQKTKEIQNGGQFSADELSKTLWVEGVEASRQKNDVRIILEYLRPGKRPCRDVVVATVFEANITSMKDKDGNELMNIKKDFYLNKVPMTVTYEIKPEDINVDKAEVEIETEDKQLFFKEDIPLKSGDFHWHGKSNLKETLDAWALPKGNIYKMKIVVTIDEHRCPLAEELFSTKLEAEIELECGHSEPGKIRKIKNDEVLEVVPQMIGDAITMRAVTDNVEAQEDYPKWTVSGYWSTKLKGSEVSFRAHGYNAEQVFWLFDYVPHSYNVVAEFDESTKLRAKIKAYPVSSGSVSLNIGQYFEKVQQTIDGLPTNGIELTFPSREESNISFENKWEERSQDKRAYLWFSGSVNLDPLIAIEGRFNLLGGITPPQWIRNYVDIGIYALFNGEVALKGAIERGEDGAAGLIEGSGVIGCGLKGVFKGKGVVEGEASGAWDALMLELGMKADEGWIQWKGDVSSGPIKVNVTFELLSGWIEIEREWIIWEGADHICRLSEGGDYENLWQYDK